MFNNIFNELQLLVIQIAGNLPIASTINLINTSMSAFIMLVIVFVFMPAPINFKGVMNVSDNQERDEKICKTISPLIQKSIKNYGRYIDKGVFTPTELNSFMKEYESIYVKYVPLTDEIVIGYKPGFKSFLKWRYEEKKIMSINFNIYPEYVLATCKNYDDSSIRNIEIKNVNMQKYMRPRQLRYEEYSKALFSEMYPKLLTTFFTIGYGKRTLERVNRNQYREQVNIKEVGLA